MDSATAAWIRRVFLVIVVPGFLALGSFGFLIHEQFRDLFKVRKVVTHLDLMKELLPLLRLFQAERGAMGLWTIGLLSDTDLEALNQKILDMENVISPRLGSLPLTEQVSQNLRQAKEIRLAIRKLVLQDRAYPAYFQASSQVIDHLINMHREAVSYPEVEEVGRQIQSVLPLIEAIERLAQYRGMGSYLLGQKRALAVYELQDLLPYLTTARHHLHSLQVSLTPAAQAFWKAHGSDSHWKILDESYQFFLLNFQTGAFPISPPAFFQQVSLELQDLDKILALQLESLQTDLHTFINRLTHRILETAAGIGFLFLVLSWIWSRYLHTLTMLNRSNQALQSTLTSLETAQQQEHDVGFQIQQQLLFGFPPKNIPGLEVESWTVPSMGVDGDFFDFLYFPDNSLHIIHGDVMGKGVPAALIGAATKNLFPKALALFLSDGSSGFPALDQVVNQVHIQLTPQLESLERFVSLHVARINLQTKVMAFINCGHTPIIHFQAGTKTCGLIEESQFPMGIIKDFTYQTHSRQLQSGDLLLFFSDGLTEMRNEQNDMFGMDRLQDFVRKNHDCSARNFILRLCKLVNTFLGKLTATDDLTAIVVKFL